MFRRLTLLFMLFSCFVFFIIPSSSCLGASDAQTSHAKTIVNQQNGKLSEMTQIPPSAIQVKVGVYPIDIYEVDFTTNTYRVDAYVWYDWVGDINPMETMEFVNAVEITKTYDGPVTEYNGIKHQSLRINARFYQPFDLRNFPLDKQSLNMEIEDTSDIYQDVVYVPDDKNSGYGARMAIPGWQVNKLSTQMFINDYGTNFGDSEKGIEASKYSNLRFTIEMTRNSNYFYWKLLLPLMIVLITNWFSLLLNPRIVEVRMAMPATALLTTIFLQMAYTDKLPELSYMVLLDKLYVIVYILIVVSFAQIVTMDRFMDEEDPSTITKIMRIDRMSVVIQIVIFISLLTYFIVTMNGSGI